MKRQLVWQCPGTAPTINPIPISPRLDDVTLYAPLSSSTNAKPIPLSDFGGASETILGKVLPVAAAFADWRDFDIIHDHTRFYSIVGSLNFEQKQKFLAEAKAVLMPLQWNDPLPTVALESLASGTPIIAWNRSSMGEIIEDGESGFLVSSIEEMASRIKDLSKIDRRACRSQLLFDSKRMARNYVDLYQTLLGA